MVGYNVQVAVDTEHHLIVTHEVSSPIEVLSDAIGGAPTQKDKTAWFRANRSSVEQVASNKFDMGAFEKDGFISIVGLAEIQEVVLRSRCPKRAFLPSGRAKKSADGSTPLSRYQNHQNGFLGAADKGLCLEIHSFLGASGHINRRFYQRDE